MNWFDLVSKILVVIVTALVGYLTGRLNKRDQRLEMEAQEQQATNEALKEGMCAILRIKLIEQHDKWTEAHYIPFYALENWDRMFSVYKKLGGNGVVEQMCSEVKRLPVNQ